MVKFLTISLALLFGSYLAAPLWINAIQLSPVSSAKKAACCNSDTRGEQDIAGKSCHTTGEAQETDTKQHTDENSCGADFCYMPCCMTPAELLSCHFSLKPNTWTGKIHPSWDDIKMPNPYIAVFAPPPNTFGG